MLAYVFGWFALAEIRCLWWSISVVRCHTASIDPGSTKERGSATVKPRLDSMKHVTRHRFTREEGASDCILYI